ncbi:MAG TPA: Uma2 family endonuclease [Blastocatellia bacterium]
MKSSALKAAHETKATNFYEYEQGGVREYWLIDPARKQAEFYQRGEDGIFRPVVADDDGKYHRRVPDGLWLQVDWLWQPPTPALMSVMKEWMLI